MTQHIPSTDTRDPHARSLEIGRIRGGNGLHVWVKVPEDMDRLATVDRSGFLAAVAAEADVTVIDNADLPEVEQKGGSPFDDEIRFEVAGQSNTFYVFDSENWVDALVRARAWVAVARHLQAQEAKAAEEKTAVARAEAKVRAEQVDKLASLIDAVTTLDEVARNHLAWHLIERGVTA